MRSDLGPAICKGMHDNIMLLGMGVAKLRTGRGSAYALMQRDSSRNVPNANASNVQLSLDLDGSMALSWSPLRI